MPPIPAPTTMTAPTVLLWSQVFLSVIFSLVVVNKGQGATKTLAFLVPCSLDPQLLRFET
jgi:hypothetical protein